MAFDGGIAASYLASFRPVQPVEGFSAVLSNAGTDALGSIPAQNAALKAQLGNTALQQIGAMELARQAQDYQRAENELTRQATRRAGALRMAGELIAQAMPAAPAGTNAGDPLGLLSGMINFRRVQAGKRAEDSLRSNAFLQEALRGIS